MSNRLDPDQDRLLVCPDLGPNCSPWYQQMTKVTASKEKLKIIWWEPAQIFLELLMLKKFILVPTNQVNQYHYHKKYIVKQISLSLLMSQRYTQKS